MQKRKSKLAFQEDVDAGIIDTTTENLQNITNTQRAQALNYNYYGNYGRKDRKYTRRKIHKNTEMLTNISKGGWGKITPKKPARGNGPDSAGGR